MIDNAYLVLAATAHRDAVPRDVRGVPAAAEGGELHDRPGGREARGGARVRALTMAEPLASWNDGADEGGDRWSSSSASQPSGRAAVRARRGLRQRRHALVREADADPGRLHPAPARTRWPRPIPRSRAAALEGGVRARLRVAGTGDGGALRRRRHERADAPGRRHRRARGNQRRRLRGAGGLRSCDRRSIRRSAARYVECGYAPMVELLRYLEANGFSNYIASGGGRDFMRPVSEEMYGIPRDRVIGSSTALDYRATTTAARSCASPRPDVLDDGPAEADPDLEPHRPPADPRRRQLERRHPDARLHPARGQAVAAPARPPRRRRARVRLHAPAPSRRSIERGRGSGWTVVSIKNDWATVFA